MMKNLLNTLFIISMVVAFDHNAYKQQFIANVVTHYKSAVGILANDIIKPLAEADVPSNSENARHIVSTLQTNVVRFNDQLKHAETNSNALRVKLDHAVESLVAQHSATQQQANQVEGEIQRTNAQIVSTDAQIADAQNQVSRADQNLRNAEESVRHAEKKVEDARNCVSRGKRNIFKKIGKVLKKIVNAPCHVINHGGINSAKDNRNSAKQHRDNLQNELQRLHNLKNQYIVSRNSLQQQKSNLEHRKSLLQNEINILAGQRNGAVAFGVNIKKVISHVTTLRGKSLVLKDTIYKLIDMETILTPLEAISSQIIGYTGDANDALYFNGIKQALTSKISQLKIKLPQYPLVDIIF